MRKYFVAGALLALILAIAGCGDSSSGGETSGTSGTSGTSDSTAVKQYDELSWASLPVRRADPITSFDHMTMSLVAPVTQGLMSYDKDGKVIPGLADSVDHPDDTTYVYTLKKGIKFSNGDPLTVEDVVYSLNRNLSDESQRASNFENVASIKGQGDNAVVIKLKQPDVTWPNVPAFAGQVIQKAAAEAGGEDKIGTPSNLPVGTGPYMFSSFKPSVEATLEPNPYWTGEELAAKRVTVKFFTDDSTMALAMRSGEVDGSFFAATQRPFQIPGVSIVTTEGTTQVVLSLNTIAAPFDDIHVRKAMAYASEREGVVQAVFEGAAEVNETLTPLALYGNVAPVEQVSESFATLPKYDFDLEAAEAELAKSKYPNGFSASVAAEQGVMVKIAQALVPEFAKIGIDLEIEQLPSSTYLAKLYGPRDQLSATIGFYGATFADPSSLMGYWLSGEQAKVNGLNSSNYVNAEVDRLLAAQAKEADGTKRLEMITSIFQTMKEDGPYIPLAAPEQFMVIADDYEYPEFSAWTSKVTPWPLGITPTS